MFRRSISRFAAALGGGGGGAVDDLGLSPAALELMKRLQAQADKKATRSQPNANAVKLIDRLKDMQMQGQWARAMSLFDNHPSESRQFRWQCFHYRCVLQLLINARQERHGLRVWDVMKERPEISLDEYVANDVMILLAAVDDADGKRLEELQAIMDERKFATNRRAERALEQRRAANWQLALAEITAKIQGLTRPDENADQSAEATTSAAARMASLEADLRALLVRHSRNRDAVEAIRDAMRAAGFGEDGAVLAARIRGTSDWVAAMTLFVENCTAPPPTEAGAAASTPACAPTTRAYNELLDKLWLERQAPVMRHVIDHMNAAKVQHSKYTVERVMRYFETTSQWREATDYFVAMKAAGVPPSNAGYGSLIKVYNRSGVSSKVMPVFEAMRKDGFQGSTRDTVSLINAWSSNRMTRISQQR